ncbi:hypothetical protein Ocin01_10716 [Orchesella cincta]|uniref:DOMON domain-containing protein n=1 Tax=Orchesella cincta TaxID=48709 RepID=A0A1D2MSH0_ORCCI|nr:hypothetical protein Ocin01_10716 [Orchesella cincta]
MRGAHSQVSGSPRWTRDLLVGNGYHIRWNNEDPEYLVMEVSAPVTGYVAVGFSPNGAMGGSDIVMGWVDSTGKAHIKDLYAEGNVTPIEDDTSDYELLWAEENQYGTTVRFRRRWDTCDFHHDFEITEDTVRIIWAVSDDDPIIQRGVFTPKYHGPDFRGGRSVFIKVPTHLMEFPDDASIRDPAIHFWDVKMKDVAVSGETDTTYHCKIFKAPDLRDNSRKHQIIGYRTLIEEANQEWVHHINFFECFIPPHKGSSDSIFEKYLDHHGEKCYTRNMPPEWSEFCITVPFVWVAGAEGLMLPQHGGIPLKEEHNGTTYFMLEIHYNNPKQIQFSDSSGIRVFVTENTRENDYGTITIHSRFGQFQMIPPKSVGFKNMAFCTSECTNSVIPKEGITVTHATLHAHLAATKMVLKHIRNGKELSPIAQDLHYDFNYQQSRIVSPPRKILPGDIIMIECDYDTSDRETITYGGTSTRDEMCQGYITYYPKIPLTLCKTQYEFHNFFHALGIHKVEGDEVLRMIQLPYKPKPNQMYDPGDDAYILKNGTQGLPEYPFDLLYVTDPQTGSSSGQPQTVREYVNALEWTKDNGKLTKKIWKQWWEGQHTTFCTGPSFKRVPLTDYLVTYPEFTPYEKPTSSRCRRQGRQAFSTANNINENVMNILLAIVPLLYILPIW